MQTKVSPSSPSSSSSHNKTESKDTPTSNNKEQIKQAPILTKTKSFITSSNRGLNSNDNSISKIMDKVIKRLSIVSFYASMNILCYSLVLFVSIGVGIFNMLQYSKLSMMFFYLGAHFGNQILAINEMEVIRINITSLEDRKNGMCISCAYLCFCVFYY